MRYAAVSIAFCYNQRLDVARLRDALSQVLSDFPVYAGRIRSSPGALQIEHVGRGAVLEVAASSEPFDTLATTANQGRGDLLCPVLSTRRALSGRGPLLSARLTETADGSVLGVTWHHLVGDFHSTMQLLRAWSQAYTNSGYDAPAFVLDRPQYLEARVPDPANAVSALRLCSASEMLSMLRFMMQRKRRVDIDFGWDELAQLQHAAMREGYVTPNDALCAHAFSVLRALAPARPVARLGLTVNYRKRLGLPANLVGNMLSALVMDIDARADMAAIAGALRARLNVYASEHADYHATRRFLDRHPSRFQRMRIVPQVGDPSGSTWCVTHWTDFGVYDLAFDGAAPALFCSLSAAPMPLMANLFERPQRRGITLSLHLPEALARQMDSPEGRARMHAAA
jgi:hypothetical protein